MVKSIISILIAVAITISLSIIEQTYVNKSFKEFKEIMVIVYEKIENDTATKEDVLSAQKYWIAKKEKLHVFIPHNEIKEIDLWLAESVVLVRDEEWTDALSKIEVLGELIEQIPKSFKLSIENIM